MRPVLAALVVLGVIVLADVASRRRAPQRQTGHGADGLMRNLLMTGAVAYTVLALTIVVFAVAAARRRSPTAPSMTRGILVFPLLLVFLASLARFFGKRPLTVRPIAPGSLPDAATLPTDPPAVAGPAATASPWAAVIGVLIAVAIIGAFVIAHLRDRANRITPRTPETDRRLAVSESIDELLIELDAERDPRRAVLLADHGMELVFARHGTPRLPSETAHEFLARVGEELAFSADAAALLTQLYTDAHFGGVAPDERARTTAIRAVRAVRDELRSSVEGSDRATTLLA